VTDEVASCILGIALGDVLGVIARRVVKSSRVHPTVNVNHACSSSGPARGLNATDVSASVAKADAFARAA